MFFLESRLCPLLNYSCRGYGFRLMLCYKENILSDRPDPIASLQLVGQERPLRSRGGPRGNPRAGCGGGQALRVVARGLWLRTATYVA